MLLVKDVGIKTKGTVLVKALVCKKDRNHDSDQLKMKNKTKQNTGNAKVFLTQVRLDPGAETVLSQHRALFLGYVLCCCGFTLT